MKRFIPLLALFAAGIMVSFALASPPPGHGPKTGSSQTSTSGGPGKSGQHGNAKCRPMNLKGTVAGGTITLNVTQAAGPRAKQLGNTAALQVHRMALRIGVLARLAGPARRRGLRRAGLRAVARRRRCERDRDHDSGREQRQQGDETLHAGLLGR